MIYGGLLDMVDSSPYGPENPTWDMRKRLESFDKKARSLSRISNLPTPVFDEERARQGMEQVERGEGIDAEDLLAQLKQEGD
jgi:hypothetical protein